MKIGYHVHADKKSLADLVAAVELRGLDPCAQIFVRGPQSTTRIPGVEQFLASATVPVYTHAAYTSVPWKCNQFLIENLAEDLILARDVIVHMGVDMTKSIEAMQKLDNAVGASTARKRVWLEINSSKNGRHTPASVADVFVKLSAVDYKNIVFGLCVDTAHVWANGYSFAARVPTRAWFTELLDLLPGVPVVIHLNDAASAFASGRDIHAPIGDGFIWRDYVAGMKSINDSGLAAIIGLANEHGWAIILERTPTADELDIVARLCGNQI